MKVRRQKADTRHMAWKRDALVGAIAGAAAPAFVVAMGWAFRSLDAPPLVLLVAAAMVPGMVLGFPIIVGAMWTTTVFLPLWVTWATVAACNAAVYAATWAVLRRAGPAAKALKVIVVTLWGLYVAFLAAGGPDRLDPFGD